MRKSILITVMALLSSMPLSIAQDRFKETINREVNLTSQENELVLKNVFGSITIEGYSGKSIVFEVAREISAKSKEKLELGKSELQLKVFKDGNRVIAHPDAPYITFQEEGLGFNWCNDNYKEPEYRHQMDFKVKVPKGISVSASTVNDGEILIRNVSGDHLKVSNVNGGIELINVTGTTKLNCINGDVTVTYTQNPPKDSKYYALNGDMNISYQNGLSANVSFKSMNGELFTDFDIEKQYTKTERSTEENKAKFKFEAKPILQIGKGEVALDFETLNGNVFIKKI